MDIQEIIEKKRSGDYELIAKMTGYNVTTVRQQINGIRKLTEKVKVAAIKVIETRERLINLK